MYIVLFVSYFSFFCLLYGRFSFILFVFVSVLLVCFLRVDPSGLIQNKWMNEMNELARQRLSRSPTK